MPVFILTVVNWNVTYVPWLTQEMSLLTNLEAAKAAKQTPLPLWWRGINIGFTTNTDCFAEIVDPVGTAGPTETAAPAVIAGLAAADCLVVRLF